MGNVYRGLPPYIVEIAKKMGINHVWETGTYLGETAILLSENFDVVSTVEASENIWKSTKRQFKSIKNINFYFGNSPTVLEQELAHGQNYFFWLDAHWSGDITFGEGRACPVLEELNAIKNAKLGTSSLICIDDARLFSAPHQLAPLMNGWPRTLDILSLLEEMRLGTFIFDDVIFGISPEYENLLMEHMLELIVSRADALRPVYVDEASSNKNRRNGNAIKLRAKTFFIRFLEGKR